MSTTSAKSCGPRVRTVIFHFRALWLSGLLIPLLAHSSGCARVFRAEPKARAMVLAAPEAVTADCFMGNPVSSQFDNIIVMKDLAYTVGFSRETRTPIWACYQLVHVDNPPDLPRPNKNFETYSDGEVTITHQDYTNSGYDRGHLAPSSPIGKSHGRDAQLATFKTTNICPQHPGLNQRCWEAFERQESDWYADRFGQIWTVTGPIFNGPCTELTTDIRVPDAMFKVVVASIDGQWEMLGIIMPNERSDASPISDFIYSVDAIEEAAGIDLFSELPDEIEDALEAKETVHSAWNPAWELRPMYPGANRPTNIRECN